MRRVGLISASLALAAPAWPVAPSLQLEPLVVAALGADAPTSLRSADVRRDPLPFTTLLASRIIHGDRDEHLDRDGLMRALGQGDLSLTCGPAADFVRSELWRLGVRSRNVQLRAPPPFNGYDDGHVLLEIETPRGDVLVDVSQKRLFLIDGRPASLEQVRARGFGAVELASLPVPARVDPAFRYADLQEAILADPRPWYERMFAGVT